MKNRIQAANLSQSDLYLPVAGIGESGLQSSANELLQQAKLKGAHDARECKPHDLQEFKALILNTVQSKVQETN